MPQQRKGPLFTEEVDNKIKELAIIHPDDYVTIARKVKEDLGKDYNSKQIRQR
ncbi:hypothetical protein C1645_836604 [Glomus cerebriforme]|uniref:Uncharacterized protein n=1 Tax=Glomus cerebriforme TaxID=658196 RepID=A0A397SAA4_9GLOM|nr:hypothetical protein C1645_836604 [Glomus cerebriforme]